MKYYVSRTHVDLDATGRLSGRETVITRPDTLKATKEALRRYTALGITNLHLCKLPPELEAESQAKDNES